MKEEVKKIFTSQYNKEAELIVRAPGRINLIGEHTDFNLGWVMPAAIDKSIYLAFSLSGNNTFNMRAANATEFVSCNASAPVVSTPHWAKYLTGIIELLLQKGYTLKGFDVAFTGDIPVGAGLSSSAALCCGFIYGLNELNNLQLTKEEMALFAQKAEHEYAGVKCGLMDQYAVLFGKENSFIQLDCRTLHVEYAPSNFEGYELILVDSCVKHSLAESAYNKRREECEEGLNLIKKRFPNVQSLRDVTATILSEVKNDLSAIVYTRVRYIVEENQRHADTCEALRLGDVKKIGALLYQTHLGLKNDYEVSCAELDFLVDTAMNITGVAGSRLMGGGFGGCSINLIKKEEAENFKLLISKKYHEKFNITPAIIEVQISNGISII